MISGIRYQQWASSVVTKNINIGNADYKYTKAILLVNKESSIIFFIPDITRLAGYQQKNDKETGVSVKAQREILGEYYRRIQIKITGDGDFEELDPERNLKRYTNFTEAIAFGGSEIIYRDLISTFETGFFQDEVYFFNVWRRRSCPVLL